MDGIAVKAKLTAGEKAEAKAEARKRKLLLKIEEKAEKFRRMADDALTADWSNWMIGRKVKWEREAPDSEIDVYVDDLLGVDVPQQVTHEPGVLWPIGWKGRKIGSRTVVKAPAPRKAKNRWFLTWAQNETPVHGPAFVNMQAYAQYLSAEVVIGGGTYSKKWYAGSNKKNVVVNQWAWPISGLVTRDRLEFPGGWQMCCEVNTTPTAGRPLTGMHGYTHGRPGIFPHPKLQLEQTPRDKRGSTLPQWTTGAMTVPNYILRKAGWKAFHHHIIGFLVFEEDFKGNIFVRDVTCNSDDGSFYDLDVRVENGVVTRAVDEKVISWGDVHERFLNKECGKVAWGIGGAPKGDVAMIDAFVPKKGRIMQTWGDGFDGRARNSHDRHNPWMNHWLHITGADSVEGEYRHYGDFLAKAVRPHAETVLIEGNHEDQTARWLREPYGQNDPVNAEIWHLGNAEVLKHQRLRSNRFSISEWMIRRYADADLDLRFVGPDDNNKKYGIEWGYHGDKSPNGARGSTAGLNRMGVRIVKGHDHTLTILDGTRSNGCLCDYPPYAKGPSSWTHGCVIGHADGKRQTVHFVGGKWRA